MSTRRTLLGSVSALILVLTLAFPALAQEENNEPPAGWSFLTLDRNFDRLLADPRDPKNSFRAFGVEDRDGTGAEASLGVDVGLARYYNPELGQTWRIGLESSFYALFDWADGGDLESRATDYWVGLNTSFSQGPWQAKLVFAHLSSHPGDYTLLNEDIDAEKVSWEVLKGTVAWSGLPFLRLYAGGSVYLTHTDWAGKGDLQAGAVLQYDIEDSPLTPYLALDLQFRERTDWEVSTSVEGGIKISTGNAPIGLRLYGFYYNGDNPFGTYRMAQETRYGAGFCIDF